jgi:hypothetical protein
MTDHPKYPTALKKSESVCRGAAQFNKTVLDNP